jgi:hypothetical protein
MRATASPCWKGCSDLEPVVGVLYRRAEREIVVNDNGRSERIVPETLLEIDIRSVNVDCEAAGFLSPPT